MEEYRLSRISNSLSLSLMASKIAMMLDEYESGRVREFTTKYKTTLAQAQQLLQKIELGRDKISNSRITGGDIVDAISIYTAAIDALTRYPERKPQEVLADYMDTLTGIMNGKERVEGDKVRALQRFFYDTAERCLRETNEQLAAQEEGEPSWRLVPTER